MHPQSVWAFEGAIPDLSAFVSDLLADDTSELVRDLRRQLSTATDVDERHAFLLIGREHVEGWPLEDHPRRGLPSDAPRLPALIDGAWLATFAAGTRVVAWLPSTGWTEGRTE